MIRFRPHHLLCTLGFEGMGYDSAFIRNFTEIKNGLTDATELEIVSVADTICGACPDRRGEGCVSQEKIDGLDRRHAKLLGLEGGQRLSWGEGKALLREKFHIEAVTTACDGCQWLPMGVCRSALSNLKENAL